MSQNTSGEQDTSGSNTSKKNSQDNSEVGSTDGAGATGPGLGVGAGAAGLGVVVLSSDKVQQSLLIKKIKDASSKYTKDIISKLAKTRVGQGVKAAKQAVSATKAGGAAIDAGKAFSKAAGGATGVGLDIITGGMQIASSAQEQNVSDGRRAYKIAGDSIGMGANIVLGVVANFLGPIGLVIMAFQMFGSILDAAWDPFKNYFNADLETMRLGIIDSLKVAYKEANMNYPIETKPDILSSINDPDSAESKEYMDLMVTYLQDRGFITSEEVIAEEEYFLNLKSLKRQRKLYRTNENGELEMQDPNVSAIALADSATNNDLIMMALAGKYIKNKQRQAKPKDGLNITNKKNYIIGAFVISALFLIFFFLSIFIASI